MADAKNRNAKGQKKPLLEWVAALIGLAITLALLGFVGWQALTPQTDATPAIVVTAERVVPVEGGYVVEVTARNMGGSTAADVQVEGTLGKGAGAPKSSVTFPYVPGQSERQGGLFFAEDPRKKGLEVRALGYTKP